MELRAYALTTAGFTLLLSLAAVAAAASSPPPPPPPPPPPAIKFRLHSLYVDNVVLQRGADGTVVGFGPPGTVVSVVLTAPPPLTAARRGKRLQAAQSAPPPPIPPTPPLPKVIASASAVIDRTGEWRVKLGALAAGGPYTLTASSAVGTVSARNMLVGEVFWVAGQSNAAQTLWDIPIMALDNSGGLSFVPQVRAIMAAAARAPNPNIRFLQVPAMRPSPEQRDLVAGTAYEGQRGPRHYGHYVAYWRPLDGRATRLYSAVGLLTAQRLNAVLKVPIGIIQVAWPGSSIQSWIDRGTMAAVNRGFARVAGARLSGASNAKQSFVPSMLRPLRGIPFNSVIWWQGETDAGLTNVGTVWSVYDQLLQGLMASWRSYLRLPNLKFHVVQLPYYASTYKSGAGAGQRGLGHWAAVREAQRRVVQKDPRADLICTIDIGSWANVHPENKVAAANRVAWSIMTDFRVKGAYKTGPTVKNVSYRRDGTATVSFSNYAAGLVLGRNGGVKPFIKQVLTAPVGCFELLGSDGRWRPAVGTLKALKRGAPRTAVLLKPLPAAKPADQAARKPKANARVAGLAAWAVSRAAEAVGQAAAAAEAAEGDAPAAGVATATVLQRRRRLLSAAKGVRYAFRDAPDGCNLYSSVLLPAVPFALGGAYPAAP